MVAEALKPSTSRPKPKGRGHAPEIDLLTRSKARNLYAVRQLGGQEVAKQTGLTVSQVYSLAQREGWSKLRAKLKEREVAVALARDEQDVKEMVEAVAIKTKVLALGTLDEAIDELANGGEFKAKNLQALSVSAKNFNGMWREAKQLDAQATQQQSGSTLSLSLFFLGAPASAASASEKTVSDSVSSEQLQRASADVIDVTSTPSPG